MANTAFSNLPEIQKAYQEWDRGATITNFKIACWIGIVLMPAGALLDEFVYPNKLVEFLALRVLASVYEHQGRLREAIRAERALVANDRRLGRQDFARKTTAWIRKLEQQLRRQRRPKRRR